MEMEINYNEIAIPDSDYLDTELVKRICTDIQEQIDYLNDIEEINGFEPEILHGYNGGTLFICNTELIEYLDLIDKAIEVSGSNSTIKESNDVYKLIADGIYYEALEIASRYMANIEEWIERNS